LTADAFGKKLGARALVKPSVTAWARIKVKMVWCPEGANIRIQEHSVL
jgi:hypothetical protein